MLRLEILGFGVESGEEEYNFGAERGEVGGRAVAVIKPRSVEELGAAGTMESGD